jgi:hypothetical protein
MGLRPELALQPCFCLDLAEEYVAEQEMGFGGVRILFEVLAHSTVRVVYLSLQEERASVWKGGL